ncbi:unnamed protein product [Clavelina lepadiformis]|uniref:Sushi domain-containing protein n=1 Tax=Clavelina lepadiformis TaxID=159417 RepID=A0ABP0GVB7_CLALP
MEAKCEAMSPENGDDPDCTVAGSLRICDISCKAGYRRSGTHLFACNLETGDWSPRLLETNHFPACIKGNKK